MLATTEDREDIVERVRAAKERYRRIFFRHLDNPIGEELYSDIHIFLTGSRKGLI